MEEKIVDEIKIENERDKNLYMQGYEQALKDVDLDKIFQNGYVYGIEVENKNFIKNLEKNNIDEVASNGEIVWAKQSQEINKKTQREFNKANLEYEAKYCR